MQQREPEQPLGTEDLEAGMRPSHATGFIPIAGLAIAMLLLFNSEALLTWTQRLPSSETSAWLAERASDWHGLMQQLGTAQLMEHLKETLRRYTPET